ncbi:MAG: hypothetical protein AUK44_05075 [Porphyromonadaceae bacterium CG2_30_38_12]|nr:MAG: hypothetical protein AUK44_05075 [Porphyromonadaceae bacterium CG2_30_38_12]
MNTLNPNNTLKTLLSFVLLLNSVFLLSQTTFTTSGTYTVPAGIPAVKVECWGGGGAGGGTTANTKKGGGGGAGGTYAKSVLNVTPSATYTVTVAASQAGAFAAGLKGNSSWFGSVSTIYAEGGNGGAAPNGGVSKGGLGSTTSSIGDILYAGGNGADGSATLSGGGGGGAGTTGTGGNASGVTAGAGKTLNGGNGGAGRTNEGNGANGSTYGGGGSGAFLTDATNHNGGSGAAGFVIVTPLQVEVITSIDKSYYATLKEAFDSINGGVHQGALTIKLYGSTTETATASLNASGTGSANYTSLSIYPAYTGVIISGAVAGALIQLNGADNVVIDGRVNLAGLANLTLTNTNTSTSATTIQFINSAENNTIQYCTIKGAGTSTTLGTVYLATATAGNGNDNNLIQYNNLTSLSSTLRPANIIYSSGSISYENSDNTIRNNNIFDFLLLGAASNGIQIAANSTAFTISGNSFYQTSTFTSTANVEYAAIRINNTVGNDFNISGNFIGGNGAEASGTWTKTGQNNIFNAIYLNIGTSNNSVQNNTITGISYTNNGAAKWYGIYLAGGTANIGTVNGNIIGAATGTGAVSFTAGATGAAFYGLYIATTNNVTCSNNIIGSITTAASATTNATNFYGIHKTATTGNLTLSNNTIGSTSTANSIQASSIATGNSQIVYGIYNLGTGSITISGNTLANIANGTTETTRSSRTRGIFSNNGANSITNNTVYKISTVGLSNGSNYANASIVGISVISNSVGNEQSIISNTVYNIETTATGKIELYGIFYDGPDAIYATISRNFVHTFVVPASGSTGSYLHGISLFDGSYIASNNIVYLGSNISIGCSIWGIWTGTNDNAKIYHNTIYLSGTATNGTSNSFSFRSLYCPASLDLRNNILWDGRINSSGTVSHYALFLNCNTNVTSNYNDYQYAQEFGIAGGTNYTTFDLWKSGTGFDANSLNVDPQINNLGGTLPVDYQTSVQLSGDATLISTIPTDYDNVNRTTPTMGAWEYFPNPVEIWNGTTFRKDYLTLKLAFDDINNGTYTGDLIIKFRGNTTETVSAVLNASGSGTASYSHILIYPARSGVTVTGNLATALVELNGAENVVFDGRVDGSVDSYQFTFINTNTSTTPGISTFKFSNSAQNDSLRYCVIKGAATGTATSNIIFGTSSTGTGNNNSLIFSNKITSVSAALRPTNAIYSLGTSGIENSANIIDNNEIYDFLNTSNDSYGINIRNYSNSFNITNNSFYETTSFAPTTPASYRIINIENSTGNSHSISTNYIGGNAALATGTWSKTNSNSNLFYAISTLVGTTASSNINGNIIRNFSYSNSANANWYGIQIAGGKVKVGTTSGNTIGSSSGNASISLNNETSDGSFVGIQSTSNDSVRVENNTIGAITTTNVTTTNATNLVAIDIASGSGAVDILKNTLGSNGTSNSLQTASIASANAQVLIGIQSAGSGSITINENNIVNLTNATTNTSTLTASRINGIYVSNGSANTINTNTISNLTIACANTSSNHLAANVGINLSNAINNRIVSNNAIFALSHSDASFAGSVVGIYFAAGTSIVNSVSRNFVHSLSSASASATLQGIKAASGNTTYSNNIISLGNATNNIIYGLYDIGATSQTCNAYFNTIYIGGATDGNNSSSAIFSANYTGTRNYRNNILFNTRTRTTGTGLHTAINYAIANATGLTVDFNDYVVSATGGGLLCLYGGTQLTTLVNMQATIGQDASSITTNPSFINGGSTVATDYKVGVTLTGTTNTAIGIDYGAYSRPGTAPTIGAWERNVNKWKGTNTTDWGTASNWTGNLVPDVDATIEFDPVPLRHCIMDIDRSVMNIINAQGAYRVVTNGKTLTIKGELLFTNGAQIDASAASSKVIFAGVTAQNIPSGTFYNNEVFNLEVNNINNVKINGTLRLLNVISSTNGYFDAYSNASVFEYGGTSAQSIENNVFLSNKGFNMNIDNAVGVSLNTHFTLNNNLTVNASKKLIINTTRTMRVQGNITNAAGATGILIKSSSTQANGSLIFFNSYANAVTASVEMYSRATWNLSNPSNNRYNWQYFGIPLRSLQAMPTFYGGYVRKQLESGTTISNHWQYLTESSIINPFYGYELCYPTTKTYTFSGELVNSNFNTGQLAKTTGALYPGQHLLANPYTAAIDIRQIEFGSDMEATVYLYNTGSFSQWESNVDKVGATPGQYISIPQNLAGYAGLPLQVPSMSSMLVIATNSTPNAYVNLNYSALVMGNTDLQRAPKQKKSKASMEDLVTTAITVKGATTADNMWLFASSDFSKNFENGYDGIKKGSATGMARLFSVEDDSYYQIDALDDMNNTDIAFKAGRDTDFTMTFTHYNTDTKYESMYLLDTKIDSLVDISESGSTYSFKANNATSTEIRFKIVVNPISNGVVTGSEIAVTNSSDKIFISSLSQKDALIKITDLAGRVLLNKKLNGASMTTLPIQKKAVYIVTITTSNQAITKKILIQ